MSKLVSLAALESRSKANLEILLDPAATHGLGTQVTEGYDRVMILVYWID